MYRLESALIEFDPTILWGFAIKTEHLIPAKILHFKKIYKKKLTCRLMDFFFFLAEV